MALFSKLKQIQDLKKQANEIKNVLADEKVEINNDGVMINMNGNQEVLEINIDNDLLTADHKEKLQRTLVKNFNDLIKKNQRMMAEKIRSSGMTLPNLN